MKLIRPLTTGATGYGITDAMLTSSTIAEPAPGETAWVSGTTYAIGDERIVAGTVHRKYRRLTAGAGTTSPEADPTAWEDIGPTARWAMFDKVVGTVSSTTSPLTVVLQPGQVVSSVALFSLVGNSVQVTVKDGPGGTVVYDSGVVPLLITDGIDDWFEYFFEPIVARSSLVLSNLPPYIGCEISVTIAGSGAVQCGTCYLGAEFDLGDDQYGASLGIIDYSAKDVDATTGRVTLAEGPFRDRVQVSIFLPRERVTALKRQLSIYRATPAVWVGGDGSDEALILFGFFKDFSVVIAYPTRATCSLELEGLT